MDSGMIDAARRTATLAALDEGTYDLLVVGGGITGAGAALDAASRGLRVALVEAGDLGGGTSSRSSRLLHGGVRYLEQLEFGLVREALRERALLGGRLAPHLVRRLPFVYPLRHRVWERAYVGAGLSLYDGMGQLPTGRTDRVFRLHRHLTRRGLARAMPALRTDLAVGALEYDDGQVDDARLTLAVARTAAREGAVIATRVRAVGYTADRSGARVTVRDELTGTDLTVRARQVLAASGVWTDEVQRLVGRETLRVRASKGVHLVVGRDALRVDRALITRTDRSVLFVIPVGATVLIGTTDTPYTGDPRDVAADGDDITFLLHQVNRWLRRPLERADVVGVYAGLRPLVDRVGTADTARLSREHVVATIDDRCLAVAGGKLTTYRVMARDAVDTVVDRLGGGYPPSVTDRLPLVGADGFHATWNRRGHLARAYGLPTGTVDDLLHRHGSTVTELLATADPADLVPVTGTTGLLRAEAGHAVRYEGALAVEDVLLRRSHAGLETADGAAATAEEIATLMAGVLGRDRDWITREVTRYRRLTGANRAALVGVA
ncbi:FAD-dependent oxidoreductase [Micromonospora echinofusca]|uniref:Glycerol-3-phosphate dehydrogenase n=1 Tax=Micromonospora echinofusca TaxID=47858 RepID=A0ABS3VSG5_MICEH|nr:glycerol-3-phosphate dehydrogenase/oxidase [Micromonospora echinofusca]MBO4207477.1 FAD-dependent oxidoreductase [Micromonospora echinofusca]